MRTKAMLLAAALLVVLLTVPGCVSPPTGTVWLDTTGDGEPDILAVDKDGDGVADLDPQGQVIPALTDEQLQKVRVALAADKYGPGILELLAAAGIPVVGLVAVGWRAGKWGRVLVNTVLSVQAARRALADGERKKLDAVLSSVQTGETKATIAKLKDKNALASASDSE